MLPFGGNFVRARDSFTTAIQKAKVCPLRNRFDRIREIRDTSPTAFRSTGLFSFVRNDSRSLFTRITLSCMRYTTPFSTLAPRKGSLIIPRFQISPPSLSLSLSLSVRHLTGTTYIVFDRLGHRVANRKVRKERFVIYVAFFPSSLPFGDSW